MAKLSRTTLEAFQQEVEVSQQEEFNLFDTVRESFDLITSARNRKVSWERLAEILRNANGAATEVSPETLRQYYFKLANDPQLLPPKKRKPGAAKKTKSNSTAVQSSVRIEGTSSNLPAISQPSQSEIEAETVATAEAERSTATGEPVKPPEKPEPLYKTQAEVKGQFNLGRRGKK